jgi:hypothetical protein
MGARGDATYRRAAKEGGVWLLSDVDYARLYRALKTFGRQLSVASPGGIAKADAKRGKACSKPNELAPSQKRRRNGHCA